MNTRSMPQLAVSLLIFLMISVSLPGCTGSPMAPTSINQEFASGSDNHPPELSIPENTPDRNSQVVWEEYTEIDYEPNDIADNAFVLYEENLKTTRYAFKRITGYVDSSTSDNNDWFRVDFPGQVIPGARTIYAEMRWHIGAWVNIYVYDKNLSPVDYLNENTPSPKKLWLTYLPPDGAPYYIRVRSADGMTPYILNLGIDRDYYETIGDDAIEEDPTDVQNAYWNTSGESYVITNFVDSVSDPDDYFKYFLDVDHEPILLLKSDWLGTEDANLNIYFYNQDYIEIKALDTDAKPKGGTVNLNSLPDDTWYYIRVEATSGQAIYQLNVKEFNNNLVPWKPEIFLFIPILIHPEPPDPLPFQNSWDPGFDFPDPIINPKEFPQFPKFHF
ncbi:MAG TPA: hypothetical protein VGB30_03185 [bacterium]|jgi:hypothetical protein